MGVRVGLVWCVGLVAVHDCVQCNCLRDMTKRRSSRRC
jgi:hypothetical protein